MIPARPLPPARRAFARLWKNGFARILWLLVATSAASFSTAGGARAACAPGSAGPRDFVCVGAIGATSLPAARTVAMTGAIASGYVNLTPAVGGNLGFSMDGNSSIAATGSDGLTLVTTGGSIASATPSGSGVNGAISASSGTAIVATTSGAGAGISLVTGSGGVLSGASGVVAQTDNDGAINLTLGGRITATLGAAVKATTADGAINITSNAAMSGGLGGVSATSSGAGPIVINASGAITAVAGRAVEATSGGAGNVTLNLSGALSGAQGVYASSGGGDVTVNATGKTTGGDGIIATTSGVGAVTVNTGDVVTATSGSAVVATTVDGVNAVRVGPGGVSGAINGVVAQATGLGSVYLSGHGNIAGGAGAGVNASVASGVMEIDLDAGVFVSGGKAGMMVSTTTGTATVNSGGTITSANGDGVVANVAGGALTLNNWGVIQSTNGNAVNVLSGAVLVANTGTISGKITDGGLTTVNNNGVWTNAAGSSISFLNNNGALSLGPAGGAPGVLTVTGAASFGPNSYYNARITPTGASDAIVVTGQTTINGGVVHIAGASGSYARGTTYSLLTSTGGISGGFTTVVSDLPTLAGVLSFDANTMYLTLLNRDFRPLALNRNQLAVASSVWVGTGTLSAGPAAQLLVALNSIPDAAVPGALTQMSGDGVVTAAANAALQAGHLFASVLDDQQSLWRSGGNGAVNSVTVHEFAYAPTYVDGGKWPVSRQQAAPAPRYAGQRTWRVWAEGFGGEQTLRGDQGAGSSTQTASAVGGAMGVDYQVGTSGLIGVGMGYSGNAFSASGAGVNGTSNGFHVGLYGGYSVGPFYGSASISYGGYQNHARRTVAVANLGESETANFSSNEVRTRIEIGRRIAFDAMAITPFTAVEIAHLNAKPFVEASSGAFGVGVFNLAYAGQGVGSLPTFVGFKAETRVDAGGAILTPWFSIAWRHEWSASRTQTATLVALPVASFVAIGAKPAPDTLQLKAGAAVQLTRTASLFATFEGEFLSKNPVYAGKGGVRFGW